MKERISKRKIARFKDQIEEYELNNWDELAQYRLGERVTLLNIHKWVCFVLDTWALPKDVQEFALTKCQFHTIREDLAGRVINIAGLETKHMILIRERDAVDVFDRPNIAARIAHEIAHAWLGHGGPVYSEKEHLRREQEADEQVKDWGVPLW